MCTWSSCMVLAGCAEISPALNLLEFKIMGLLMMMMPFNWATNQCAPAVHMHAGQSGLQKYRINQLTYRVTNDVHILCRKCSLSVLFDLHHDWLYYSHWKVEWVSQPNLDWHLWLDLFQLIDWMRLVCRFGSWFDAAFLMWVTLHPYYLCSGPNCLVSSWTV